MLDPDLIANFAVEAIARPALVGGASKEDVLIALATIRDALALIPGDPDRPRHAAISLSVQIGLTYAIAAAIRVQKITGENDGR